ncbi:MAG: helix-turn-helix domain-containing protein [Candidatus Tectomicrobia bacterium]|uniref:Helix-turn-helix domain-containing protein n=1 Tax=Tectimicrobiota bacterium TaxID=2528274 RepID=A0A933LQW6_UNCTE|nr:helix-turn-helix domain-containing protein [Candidatus Tectomicrobia bacterium]
MQKLLTTKEVADILRMRIETITRKAECGILPAIKVDGRWRIPQDRFDEWLREKEAASPAERKIRLGKPIKLKTYRMGKIYGPVSRAEIYQDI